MHLPVLLHCDAVSYVQRQVPCGVRTLKEAYSDANVVVPSLDYRSGTWLARLHA